MYPALAFTCLIVAANAASQQVTLDVKREGLKYTGPCRATIFDDKDAVAQALQDTAKPAVLPPGAYQALVQCPSTEGTFSKTTAFSVERSDETVRVAMEPGFLLVHATRDGVVVKARVSVKDERGREVAQGPDRAVLPVPPGRLAITVRVSPDAAGVEREVLGYTETTVQPGSKATVTVDTTDGTLLVVLKDNGRAAAGVAALRLPGRRDRFVEFEAGKEAMVPPGVYDVVTTLAEGHDFHEETKKGVVVKAKQRTAVTIEHRTGALRPQVVLDGKRFTDDVDVEVFKGEAPGAFATIAASDTARLAPGGYRLRAARKGATLDDGTAWEAFAKVSVSSGSAKDVALDLSPARIVVDVKVGGVAKALPVQVFVPGAGSPTVERDADDKGRFEAALAPGRYLVRAVLQTAQGPLAAERLVTLKKGLATKVSLALDVGVVVVQAFEAGVSVPAEVSFYNKVGTAPLVTVGAGEEAFLPPGAYTLVVVRKGVERRFGDLKVAAGRTLLRQVELAGPPGPTTPPVPSTVQKK